VSNYVIERENSDGTISLSISSHQFIDETQSSTCFETDEQAAQYLLDELQANPQARASTFERLSAQATVEHWSYCNVITHLSNNAGKPAYCVRTAAGQPYATRRLLKAKIV
jgi:hypothetical protein